MKPYRFILGLCLLAVMHQAPAQDLKLDKKVTKSLKKVEPEDIKKHIWYLADDKLLGRKPGTPGYETAVAYVIDQYKKMGVQPGGENGTYLQTVKLRTAKTGDASMLLTDLKNTSTQLTAGKDFAVYPNPKDPSTTVQAPLVFAGYGITAPDLGYDDYAGLDAKGKIVVVMRGAPESFPNTVSSYSMDLQTILKNAAEHGAVGVIVGSANPKAPVTNLRNGVNNVMHANGEVAFSRTYHEDIKLLAAVNQEVTDKLLTSAGINLTEAFVSMKSGKPASTELGYSATAAYTSNYKDIESHNVIGKIEGSDPQLKNEYVMHSAHLDHVGIGAPVDGDSIYNGAHDNASGVASLLEIANVYSRLKKNPKRSVLLVMVTAEEMGLLGSAYFAKYPTVPANSIVADINTDMPTIIAPLLSVVPLGAPHSSLMQQVTKAADYLDLDIEADPEPDQNRFVRSDQYSFVTQGIPALHIKYGNKTADGKNNLDETVKVWRAKYYHKPQDGIDGVFDFEAGKKYVQLNFLIGYLVAQSEQRPTWNQGDFFGTRFGR
ncbi:M28 family peptidase [Pontibacter cellulosilyticus]|uniref:M28 family peptidase n=1 Tax=Pontibacter cellulosilyticus TaxID=1720253 RepID=A0A923N5M0_9BACT|nr:M28 family peptidase [Pontibacter cellulosilyticus]MBC5992643.1 M28 family peptidase [Pontibacter cellulosilyticus]